MKPITLPSSDTPLYNHPLPAIEEWLKSQGCEQSKDNIHCWHIKRPKWKAELCMDSDQFVVRYFEFGDSNPSIQRIFKYSLSRQDLEDAIFAGP